MFSFLTRYFDQQSRTITRYEGIVAAINSHESALQDLSDAQLADKTQSFRDQLASGTSLETILPEAYAVVREAARRSLGLRHYDVQLMAGLAFHEGKVAEQRTGEGKTLSATTALYLNALEGKGAHLVTVNDYLAQVGAGWMGPLYTALGMSVAVIGHETSLLYDPEFTGETKGDERLEHFRPVSRQEAYRADITYGTNNEFGFDYLRDNMAQRLENQVQRGHHYAIVDEADSILIDEARTPLIISAPDAEPTDKYRQFASLVKKLTAKADYQVDEKMKTAVLTDLGVKRLERLLGVQNLYEESFETIHHAEQALKAETVFQRDVDYVVREGEVIIVDEHTGRLMHGRRYSDGLHQAIEAKEAVTIQQESRTLATISLQNYFRLYSKLAGMSGTAVTESEEFQSIYDMDVVVIPTNKPVVRQDFPDMVFKTQRAKMSAIVHEVERVHLTGRPILIGTRSIDQNQVIAKALDRKNIKFQVLNAKNHEKEAFIIAEAGKPGAITVATNIAGRGVDIVLGGAQPERREFETKAAYETARKEWQAGHDAVKELGGLHIVGTARHEARRIDNQLRGRAGRQGDPGSSRFFVSMEDEIMRLFGGEQMQRIMDAMHIDETMPIEHPLITRAITQAQIKVEGFFFDQRKNLVEYDNVMNRQREVIYTRRRQLLESMDQRDKDEVSSELQARLRTTFIDHMQAFLNARAGEGLSEIEEQNVSTEIGSFIPFDLSSLNTIQAQVAQKKRVEEILELVTTIWDDTYRSHVESVGENVMREIELYVFLSTLDEQWMNHLDDMTSLRDGIWLRGGKEQALAEYKKEAFALFDAMIQRIELEAAKKIFRIQVAPAAPTVPQKVVTSGPAEQAATLTAPEVLDAPLPPSKATGTNALAAALNAANTASQARQPVVTGRAPKKASKGNKPGKKKRKKGSYL